MNRFITLSWLWILALVLPTTGLAEEPSLKEVIAVVEAPFQDTSGQTLKDLKTRFEQVSHIATLDQTQEANGQLWLQYDKTLPADSLQARFRWVYAEPLEQLFISDGLTIWVYLPDNNQVIVSPTQGLEQQPGVQNPVTLLTGLGNLSRDFNVQWAEPRQSKAGDYRVRLTPRQPSPYLSAIELNVAKQRVLSATKAAYFPLKELMVVDANGNQTQIRFADIQVNGGVTSTLFQFEPPEGVDVLRPEDINPGS